MQTSPERRDVRICWRGIVLLETVQKRTYATVDGVIEHGRGGAVRISEGIRFRVMDAIHAFEKPETLVICSEVMVPKKGGGWELSNYGRLFLQASLDVGTDAEEIKRYFRILSKQTPTEQELLAAKDFENRACHHLQELKEQVLHARNEVTGKGGEMELF